MIFEIGKNDIKEIDKTPRYKLKIKFMHGDADGWETSNIEFKNTPEGVKDLERTVLAVAACCELYPHGRGGYDEYKGYPYYDAFFQEASDSYEWYDFLFSEKEWNDLTDKELMDRMKEYLDKLNPEGYWIEHPYDGDMATSIHSYKIKYLDENGSSSPVDVKFNEAEKLILEKAKTFWI